MSDGYGYSAGLGTAPSEVESGMFRVTGCGLMAGRHLLFIEG
jgi:hypothetical protein